MARQTRGASMVPLDQQMAGGGGRGTRTRRTLAQRLEDAQREITELKWSGVRDSAANLSAVLEANVLDKDEQQSLENIHNQMVELLREKGMEVGAGG